MADFGRKEVLFLRDFIAHEFRFLLWCLCCGAMLGAAYRVLVVFRRLVRHHVFFVALEDVLYWFLSAFVMFAVILVANDGAARWFSIAGMVVGMIIVSFILKYMEKGVTIIYHKLGKVCGRKDGRGKRKAEKCHTKE